MNLDSYKFTAHRGLFNNKDIPENSMKAFEEAMHKGYAIELDIQMTKDGYLVVFHDKSLKRVCGIKNEIPMLTLNEVKQARLCGTDSMIPTFEDVLMLVSGKVPLLIEVKEDENYEELMPKLMSLLERYEGEYMIESFDPRIVLWLKKNHPSVIRGQLSSKNIREVKNRLLKFILGNMFLNVITKPHFIAYLYTEVTPKFYKKHHKKGRQVAVWTVKSKEEYEKVKDMIDICIFENEETTK